MKMSKTEKKTEQEYLEEISRLTYAYDAIAAENVEIKSSKAYRLSLLIKKIIVKLHLEGTVRFLLSVRRNGIKQAWRDYRARKNKETTEIGRTAKFVVLQQKHNLSEDMRRLIRKGQQYEKALVENWTENTKAIAEILEQRSYKGIVVCPETGNKDMLSRASRLLESLEAEGFLCFLCSTGQTALAEKRANFFEVSNETDILHCLQNKCPVVLVTDCTQASFVDALPQSVIWVDLTADAKAKDRNSWEEELRGKLLAHAALITYSEDCQRAELAKYPTALKVDAEVTQICQVVEKLTASHEGMRALADFRAKNSVAVISVTFFKYDGTTYYSGGAERYLLDLHEICEELNVNYRIYQYAEYNWVRFYNQIEVVGLNAKQNDVDVFGPGLIKEMDDSFNREVTQGNKVNIYSPFYIISGNHEVTSVGISHGISWDNENNHYMEGSAFWSDNKNIIDSATYCDRMISVDTNTCNWFQTLDYHTGRKIHYIPNYVNNQEFYPRENYLEQNDKVVITYPRRLYGARGLYVVLEVIDDILSRYPNVEFHFVGKGFEQDTKHVEKKIEQWGDRVKWYSKAPNQMHEVYKMTDISLIPTMYSEGTSLSCLEALSSGNVVIATRIGGLTDLILSDYNGKLVEPTGKAIKEALFDLLDNPEKMVQLKKNAVDTARAFSKNKWKSQWKNIISEFVSEEKQSAAAKRCMIQLTTKEAMNQQETIRTIREYLEDGWYVYVACKNNPMRYNSYKRLQYIDLDEDLYFIPEKKIVL